MLLGSDSAYPRVYLGCLEMSNSLSYECDEGEEGTDFLFLVADYGFEEVDAHPGPGIEKL